MGLAGGRGEAGWTGPLQVGLCAPGGCAGAWHDGVSGGAPVPGLGRFAGGRAVIWDGGWPGKASRGCVHEGVHGLHTGLQSGGAPAGTWGSKDVFVGKDPRDWFRACACLP